MSRQINLDSPLWSAITTFSNILILNMLFVMCCIPIFTIGASLSALYAVMLKLAGKEDIQITKEFFSAFKSNFKQSTMIWLLFLAIGIFLLVDFWAIKSVTTGITYFMLYAGLCVIGIVYAMVFSYVFPLQSKFENSIKALMKNAFALACMHLVPATVIIVLLNASPWILYYFRPELFFKLVPYLITLAFGAIAYANSKILSLIFAQYISHTSDEA